MVEAHEIQESIKHFIDGASALVTVAALTELLPPIAALLTIIWTAIRIFEWIHKKIRDKRRRNRRCADEQA